MLYYREISLKDQRKCLLKNAERADAAAFLHYFTQAHAETDFLTTYADEGTHSVEDMEERKRRAARRLRSVHLWTASSWDRRETMRLVRARS